VAVPASSAAFAAWASWFMLLLVLLNRYSSRRFSSLDLGGLIFFTTAAAAAMRSISARESGRRLSPSPTMM